MSPARKLASLALAIPLIALASTAFAEPKTLGTLDDIAAEARRSSLSYQQALAAARSAQIALPGFLNLESSTLSTSYASYADSSSSTSKGLTVSASLPIIDQLSLTGKAVVGGSDTIGATLTPLSHADTKYQALIAYQKALAAADEAGRSASEAALKDALSWMSAARKCATLEASVKVMQDTYDATKAANAIDAATTTVDDLITALKNLSTARASLVTAQGAERKALGTLCNDLGAARSELDIKPVDIDALAAAVSSVEASLEQRLDTALGSSSPASYAASLASLTVDGDKSALSAIWDFEPALSVTGSMVIATDGTIAPKVTAVLTLSPVDFTKDKKEVARSALELAQKSLAQQKTADQNSYDEAVAAVKAAKISSEGSRIALRQAQDVADVAAFNQKTGDSSELEMETAALSVTEAQDTLYQSLADEYSAWLDLAAYELRD
jgi:hypothetical protein